MDWYGQIALIGIVPLLIAMAYLLYTIRYETFRKPKKERTGCFWKPIPFPENGEDLSLCDLCHGRLGPDKIASCICGKRYHIECISLEVCPGCGNTLKHMRIRDPYMMRCPICLSLAPDGHCEYCGAILPHGDGTFKCSKCGGVVFTSDPLCKKCGCRYVPRETKGFMDRVYSRRR